MLYNEGINVKGFGGHHAHIHMAQLKDMSWMKCSLESPLENLWGQCKIPIMKENY